MRYRLIVVCAISLTVGSPGSRLLSAENPAVDLRRIVSSVRTPEIPREVARRISLENGPNRSERCVAWVRAAVEYKRASATAIVGAAAHAAPDLAPKFAACAASVEYRLAAGIARAAAAGAPEYAGDIAAAVAKEQPAQYAQIAYETAYAVPSKDGQIVNAVLAGLPNLQAFTAAPTIPIPTAGQSRSVTTVSLDELVATATQVQNAARELGMETDQFLVAELTPAQCQVVVRKVQTLKVSTASNSSSLKAAVKGGSFVPGAGTPGEEHRAQPIVVTPGEGRSYEKPGNGPR